MDQKIPEQPSKKKMDLPVIIILIVMAIILILAVFYGKQIFGA
jgi:hypothetical protein